MNQEHPSQDDPNNATGDPKEPRETTVTPESLGLTAAELPANPEEALAAAKKRDRVDSSFDCQVFIVRTRRAVLLEKLKSAKVHRHFRLRWEDFVEQHFGGYDTWSRYRAVARVQAKLHKWGMPLVSNEAQARVIVPRLRDSDCEKKLREMLAENGGKFPPARTMALERVRTKKPAAGSQNQTEALLWELLSSRRLLKDEQAAIRKILERITAAKKEDLRDEKLDTAVASSRIQTSWEFAN